MTPERLGSSTSTRLSSLLALWTSPGGHVYPLLRTDADVPVIDSPVIP